MIQIIDPHLHLFALAQGEYHWLKPENHPFWPDKKVINQSFDTQDIELTPPLQLQGFVHIEAGFDNNKPWREIEYLEQEVQQPMKTIACCDLTLAHELFIKQIAKTTAYQSVVGFRHILDNDAKHLLVNPVVHQNLNYLAQQQLIFELQMPLTDTKACSALFELLSKMPALKLSINHAGFAPVDLGSLAAKQWQQHLTELAQLPQLLLKCSGFEMQQREYNKHWLQHLVDNCLTLLGENNVCYASNFPLCLFQQSYQQTWLQYLELFQADQKLTAKLCAQNAQQFYQF